MKVNNKSPRPPDCQLIEQALERARPWGLEAEVMWSAMTFAAEANDHGKTMEEVLTEALDEWDVQCYILNMSNNNSQGVRRYSYIPALNGANPLKKEDKKDWWDEMCKKHGEENHFPKDKPKDDKSNK